jgi:hypothetical protein
MIITHMYKLLALKKLAIPGTLPVAPIASLFVK